jgi:hypothetical protein
MYMGFAVEAFKYAGYQYIADAEGGAADGTCPFQTPINAVYAAPNMHQTVFAPGYGRKRQSSYQIAFVES